MSISSSLAASANYVNTTVIPAARNTMDMTTFLQMLTTELSNQDPTKPMDDSAMAGQIAQMSTVQGMSTLTQQGQISEASALIGKTVSGTADSTDSMQASGGFITGKVVGLSVQSGKYYLMVQEANGGLAQMQTGNIQSVGS